MMPTLTPTEKTLLALIRKMNDKPERKEKKETFPQRMERHSQHPIFR